MKSLLKKQTLMYTLGLLFMAGAVGLLGGCGDQAMSPTGPDDGQVVVHNTGKGNDDAKINGNGGAEQSGLIGNVVGGLLRVVEQTVTSVVGVVGGTLDVVLTSGQSKLAIPSGALNRPVRIEMNATQSRVGDRFYTEYEFGPHGLVFNKPSTLSLSLPYRDGTVVSLTWFNPDTRQWELQASKPVRNGKVEFSVYHFSKYGIS